MEPIVSLNRFQTRANDRHNLVVATSYKVSQRRSNASLIVSNQHPHDGLRRSFCATRIVDPRVIGYWLIIVGYQRLSRVFGASNAAKAPTALFNIAWGNAPGFKSKNISADSATHICNA